MNAFQVMALDALIITRFNCKLRELGVTEFGDVIDCGVVSQEQIITAHREAITEINNEFITSKG